MPDWMGYALLVWWVLSLPLTIIGGWSLIRFARTVMAVGEAVANADRRPS